MRNSIGLSLAILAGTALSFASAKAQDLIPLGNGPALVLYGSPVGYPGHGYQQRDITPVYDNLVNGGGFYLGNCSSMIDDISLTNGPWETPGAGHKITEMTFGVTVNNPPTYETMDEQIFIIFWRKGDVNFQGFAGANTNMIRAGATPIQVIRYDYPAGPLPTPNGVNIVMDLTGLPGGGITVPATDDAVYVQVTWITHGFTPTNNDYTDLSPNGTGSTWAGRDANTLLPLPPCPNSLSDRSVSFNTKSGASTGGSAPTIGFSLRDYGRDISRNDGAFAARCGDIGKFIGNGGDALPGTASEHRYISSTSDAYAYNLQLKGDYTPVLPSPVTDLGCVPDSGLSANGSVATNGAKWYTVCLNGDVRDTFLQFADFDTEGSAADVAMALYTPGGNLIASDDDSGSGNNAQLTFGIGIRAAVGNGEQYNGRSGEFLAGTYYLCVAPKATQFKFGFRLIPSGNAGGNFHLNAATNVNTGALAPSVPPAVVFDAGDIGSSCFVETPPTLVDLTHIIWYKFSTTFDTATDLSRYVDIAFNGTGYLPSGDPQCYLFDNSGNYVATDDDSGPDALSQFSFSHPVGLGGPADRPALPPGTTPALDGLPFAGQNGDLAAGTYYLGVGIFQVLTDAAQDRWHLRPTSSETAATVAMRFSTGASCCPPCAADFNQDGGVDGADVEAFYTAWSAGDACGDTNQDGGVDGSDVAAFFVPWEAGGC